MAEKLLVSAESAHVLNFLSLFQRLFKHTHAYFPPLLSWGNPRSSKYSTSTIPTKIFSEDDKAETAGCEAQNRQDTRFLKAESQKTQLFDSL